MRAIVFASEGTLALEDRPEPELGPKDVLVETAAVGVCGTDTHVFDGEFEGTVYPLVPGHEATGVVVAVGSDVTTVAPGAHVAVNPSTSCGERELCLNGKPNLCRFWNGLGVVASDGAAQERLVAPAANVYPLRPDTDLYEAALIEPLACAIRGYDLLPRRMGDHYLIHGAGTMGLLMAQSLRAPERPPLRSWTSTSAACGRRRSSAFSMCCRTPTTRSARSGMWRSIAPAASGRSRTRCLA